MSPSYAAYPFLPSFLWCGGLWWLKHMKANEGQAFLYVFYARVLNLNIEFRNKRLVEVMNEFSPRHLRLLAQCAAFILNLFHINCFFFCFIYSKSQKRYFLSLKLNWYSVIDFTLSSGIRNKCLFRSNSMPRKSNANGDKSITGINFRREKFILNEVSNIFLCKWFVITVLFRIHFLATLE